jgi:heme transport system ATP-binding protein
VLSQHVELAFLLPAEDAVLMGRYPHYGRTSSPRDREIFARAIELVGMGAKRSQPYPTLSSGEQAYRLADPESGQNVWRFAL